MMQIFNLLMLVFNKLKFNKIYPVFNNIIIIFDMVSEKIDL